MTGILGLVGAVVGLVNGVAPKLVNAWDDHRKTNLEIMMLEKQQDFQLQMARMNADARVDETQYEAMREEIKAQTEVIKTIVSKSFKKTGYEAVDKINAFIRPSFMVMMLIFIGCLCSISIWSVMGDYFSGSLTAVQVLKSFEGTFAGLLIEGSIGWFLGYRSVVSKTSK